MHDVETREAIYDRPPIQHLHQIGLLEFLEDYYSRILIQAVVAAA